jgi:hypothetical protein
VAEVAGAAVVLLHYMLHATHEGLCAVLQEPSSEEGSQGARACCIYVIYVTLQRPNIKKPTIAASGALPAMGCAGSGCCPANGMAPSGA